MPQPKYTKELLETAKGMYLQGKTIAYISRETYINRSTLNYHIEKHWKKEKEARNLLNSDALAKVEAKDLKTMIDDSVIILQRAIEAKAHGGEAPSIKDAQAAVQIMTAIRKFQDEHTEKLKEETKKKEYVVRATETIDPLAGDDPRETE